MFKQLFEFLQQTLFLQRDAQRLKEDVAHLERELHESNELLRTVLSELQRLGERETFERQKLELRIEKLTAAIRAISSFLETSKQRTLSLTNSWPIRGVAGVGAVQRFETGLIPRLVGGYAIKPASRLSRRLRLAHKQ